MKILTEQALLVCEHELGHVKNQPSQNFVRIGGQRVLVEDDPKGRSISGCPLPPPPFPGGPPCLHTITVEPASYSALLTVHGHRICLDITTGLTDGMTSGTIKYKVRNPGQTLVETKL
jgi:hypothetical protein